MSLRTLFDAFISEYFYTEDSRYYISYEILMVMHIFVCHIFLFNYLVAILSTVFTMMAEASEFSYRCDKYEFIEKYSIPMLDEDGYKELVIHPPPFNFMTIPILFAAFSRKSMRGVGH